MQMWALYEKRIDQFLAEHRLKVAATTTRASVRHGLFVTAVLSEIFQTVIQLQKLATQQQETLAACKREIDRKSVV